MSLTRRFFVFFFASGFCSLVYEVVWMRLSMSAFGANTAAISIFVSIFMGGLGLGCWLAGRWKPVGTAGALRRYALAEIMVGVGGAAAPSLISAGHQALGRLGEQVLWQSWSYHAAAGLCLCVAVLPWSAAMGATLPLGMAAIAGADGEEALHSFSSLYGANSLGAAAGTIGAAFVLIELLGFSATGRCAAVLNGLIALSALALARRPHATAHAAREGAEARPHAIGVTALLFLSGLLSLAMEIAWTRQYSVFLGNHVYAFAMILWTYLCATFLGCEAYRSWAKAVRATGFLRAAFWLCLLAPVPLFVVDAWISTQAFPWRLSRLGFSDYAITAEAALLLAAGAWVWRRCRAWLDGSSGVRPGPAWTVIGFLGLLPVALADPGLPLGGGVSSGVLRLVLGIGPYCAATGFMTAWLVDLAGRGRPEAAAKAYAVNTLGCLLGPLVAGFVLLPRLSERHAIIGLCVPYIGIGLTSSLGRGRASAPGNWVRVSGAALAAACALGFWSAGFENLWPNREVRRDPSASVVAWGNGFEKMLSINGIMGITMLVPETKMMAHLPLASLSRRPRNALVLCFGMGTTFRSALSWGIPVTVVELIPSVPELFGFFHPDGPRLLERPGARVVIDDARRFLDRSGETFDVITLDPAPPVTATGTSLLYSKEFYEAARRRLAPDGVLQTWCLFAESITVDSMAKALRESFPYVRAFRIGTRGGFHFLASGRPIPARDAKELAARLPLAAASDLMEWEHGGTPQAPFKRLLAQEGPIEWLARADSGVPALTDDRPVNEYFLLRWLGDRWHSRER